MERAKEWLNCEEYREARKMRHRTAKTRMILVEGLYFVTAGSRRYPNNPTSQNSKSKYARVTFMVRAHE
jgi:hypothetical protein